MNLSILIKPPLSFPFPLSKPTHNKTDPSMRISNTTTTTSIHTSCVTTIIPTTSTTKRTKTTANNHQNHQSLLPGYPDHIAQLCLSLVPPSTLSSVCHSWRRLIYSPSFSPFLSIYTILLPTQTPPSSLNDHQLHVSNVFEFASFDPISSRWLPLPPLPPDPPLNFLLRHPSFLSRNFPVQFVAVSGSLVLLAATDDHFLPALSRPLIFNPLNGSWTYGPMLSTPRRWCATGSSAGVVYVASGMGSHYSPEVARSVEKWDLNNNINGEVSNEWKWEKMEELRDGKFSREAINAIGWRGKLCMVNVKGDAAKEGIVYNVKDDEWEEMPEGMLQGWRGPAAAMDEEVIFAIDETEGVLKKYDPEKDDWDLVFENEMLKGATSVAVGGGRACVVCGGGRSIFVVDVVAVIPRFWVVEAPQGFEALDVHILPRMTR